MSLGCGISRFEWAASILILLNMVTIGIEAETSLPLGHTTVEDDMRVVSEKSRVRIREGTQEVEVARVADKVAGPYQCQV